MGSRRRRDIWDVLVVGGGIAGVTAAWHAARRGLTTALLESAVLGGQVAAVNRLDGWPAVSTLSGAELASSLADAARACGVEILQREARIVRADQGLLSIETESGTLRGRRLLLAAGSHPRPLRIPGEDTLFGKGVSRCADCDAHFFRGQDVVVIGGGDAALQEALVLAPNCRSVRIVVRSALRARRAYVERAGNSDTIRFVWDTVPEAIIGKTKVEGVRLRNMRNGAIVDIECGGVFPFVGCEPNTLVAPAAVRRTEGGCIITDSEFRTSMPAIFAVGALRDGYSGDLISAAGEAAAAVSSISRDLAG